MKVSFSQSELEKLHIEIETDSALSTEGSPETRIFITCRKKATVVESVAEQSIADSTGERISIRTYEDTNEVPPTEEEMSAIRRRISQQYSPIEPTVPEDSKQNGQEQENLE